MREFRKKIYRELRCEHFCVTLFQKKKKPKTKKSYIAAEICFKNNNNNNKTKKSLNSRFIKKKPIENRVIKTGNT